MTKQKISFKLIILLSILSSAVVFTLFTMSNNETNSDVENEHKKVTTKSIKQKKEPYAHPKEKGKVRKKFNTKKNPDNYELYKSEKDISILNRRKELTAALDSQEDSELSTINKNEIQGSISKISNIDFELISVKCKGPMCITDVKFNTKEDADMFIENALEHEPWSRHSFITIKSMDNNLNFEMYSTSRGYKINDILRNL